MTRRSNSNRTTRKCKIRIREKNGNLTNNGTLIANGDFKGEGTIDGNGTIRGTGSVPDSAKQTPETITGYSTELQTVYSENTLINVPSPIDSLPVYSASS